MSCAGACPATGKGGIRLTTVDLPGEVFVRRARSARARKKLAREGTSDWLAADAAEREALEGLKREFGVTDMSTLNWLVERSFGK